jgi:tricorn protease
MPSGYLRQPTLFQDTVIFVCDDDLWSVSTSGGAARRLTAGSGEVSTPVLSRDGRFVAYVSRDEHHPEVYLMEASGGPARRMTWLGPDVMVRGFTPEGEILLVTTFGQPFFRNYRAHALPIAGGLPRLLPLGQVNHLAWSPAGACVIGRNTADPARWKRYRGGTAGHLWVDVRGLGEFERLTSLKGNITSPMWIGERLYFISDYEGIGNLYSCVADGSDVRRATDQDRFYVRNAQTDGSRIVFQCAADLWLFDPATGASRRLAVDIAAHRHQTARKFVPAARNLGGMRPHPKGHSMAYEVRGRLLSAPLWEGAVRHWGTAEGTRQRFGQWLADGATMVCVADGSGEERIEVYRGAATQTHPWDIGRVLTLVASPVGERIALANHRNEVMVCDLARDHFELIDRSDAGRTEDLAFSPDGRWLAYTFWTSARHCAIKLRELETGRAALVTRPEFRDYCPAFDPAGRYLYFLSVRTFDPVYDSVQFELSFPRAARPYVLALAAAAPSPFEPAPKAPGEERATGDKPAPEIPVIEVDLEGIERRIAAFPVPEGRYGQIGGAHGKVFWTAEPIQGAHGRGGTKEAPARLEVFDFDTQQVETWLDQIDRFSLSEDRSMLAVRHRGRARALDTRRKPDSRGDSTGESGLPSRRNGWLDLERLRVSVEPRLEWQQMFREVWRLQRDQFWVADMSGVDWEAVYHQYRPLLDRVATRAELSDLIWEVQGELGTSHAYEMGGDHRRPATLALGQLAADLRFATDASGYEIAHIVEGDPWDAAADSPLNGLGVAARVGERITSVNGRPVTLDCPPQALLVHQAGMKVALELAPDGGGATRSVVLRTLEDEVPARYREWVEQNRRWVHEKSAGQVGYLHLPDMQSAGFAEFHRYFGAECDRAALIIDVRYNRGGHVSQLLLEKVARKRIGYDLQRWGLPTPYPGESPAGPLVALTNEHAGSDGDIFSHCFKLMRLGPLVGQRTWGGVIGIWPRHLLVDGTETTQPEFSFWFSDVGWGVENYGTDPDIAIENRPQDARDGIDRQLERSLEVALHLCAAANPVPPEFGARPNLARRPLPPAR